MTRRFAALINPISGRGRAAAAWRPLAELLQARGAAVTEQVTRSAAHASELAASASARGDVVVAVGGDGLVRDAAAGAVAAGGTLAIVPAGRGNDLARLLRIPTEPEALAALLLDGAARKVDVLDINGAIAVGNAYAGVDSMANHVINRGRWLPAQMLYRIAPVRTVITWRAPTYTIGIDGTTRTMPAHTVVVANSGSYGHGLRIVPPAVLDDGRLDVLTVGAGPRRQIVAFMREAHTGAHVHRDDVELATGVEVTLDADRPLPLYADGDYVRDLPAAIKIRPGALSLLAP